MTFANTITLHSKAYKLLDIKGVGCPQYMGSHQIIRDCPFAHETVWQFGHSLFWGVQSVENSSVRNKHHLTLSLWLMLFFRPSPRSISVTLQRFNYSNCSCGVALRAAVRGAGDKELCKEGHHTASGAITRMNDRHPPQVCPIMGWGISKGGAWEAITVIPSPSDHSCQLKSLAPKLFMILYCSVLHISLSCCSLICRATSSWLSHTHPLPSYIF